MKALRNFFSDLSLLGDLNRETLRELKEEEPGLYDELLGASEILLITTLGLFLIPRWARRHNASKVEKAIYQSVALGFMQMRIRDRITTKRLKRIEEMIRKELPYA